MLSLPPVGELLNIWAAASPPACRAVVVAVQHAARGLDPVVHEDGLHLRHHRAKNAEMGVTPLALVLRRAAPLVGDADASRETCLSIDNQHLAVRAIVQARQIPPLRLVIPHDLDTRGFHGRQCSFVHLHAADPVQQHMHFHASGCAFGQCGCKFFPDRPRPVDVGLECDGAPGRANFSQHDREYLIAVEQLFDLVAIKHLRAEQCTERTPKLRVVSCIQPGDLLLDLLFAGAEVEEQHHSHERGQEGRNNGPAFDSPHEVFLFASWFGRVHGALPLNAITGSPISSVQMLVARCRHGYRPRARAAVGQGLQNNVASAGAAPSARL